MYILTNAFQNLGRNKGRNILIGVIIFAIIITSAVSLIINSTTGAIINDYKNRFGARATISHDMDKIASSNALLDVEPITVEQHKSFSQSEYLQNSVFSCEMPSVGSSLSPVGESIGDGGVISSGGSSEIDMPYIKTIGNSYPSSLPEFSSGERQITEGTMYYQNGECIVSKEFAEMNQISVGDTIKIKSNQKSVTTYIEMTVSGIYYDATKEYGDMPFKDAYINRRNEVITNFETLTENADAEGSFFDVKATYYLKSPDDLEAFESDLRRMGLPDYYKVGADDALYKTVVGPVEGLKGISITFMLVVFVLGAIILILLSTIAMRERKYEIGVLRAMGLKKWKVAIGLLAETIMLTTICLTIGLGIGAVTAQPVANTLLEQQIEEAKNNSTPNLGSGMIMMGGGGVSIADEETLSEIDITLTSEAIMQIIGLSLLLASIASVVGISFITRYEPIRILTERN